MDILAVIWEWCIMAHPEQQCSKSRSSLDVSVDSVNDWACPHLPFGLSSGLFFLSKCLQAHDSRLNSWLYLCLCKQTPRSCCFPPSLSLSPWHSLSLTFQNKKKYKWSETLSLAKLNQAAPARLQSLLLLTSSFSLSKQIFPQIRSKWVFPGGGRSSAWLMDTEQGCSVTCTR